MTVAINGACQVSCGVLAVHGAHYTFLFHQLHLSSFPNSISQCIPSSILFIMNAQDMFTQTVEGTF